MDCHKVIVIQPIERDQHIEAVLPQVGIAVRPAQLDGELRIGLPELTQRGGETARPDVRRHPYRECSAQGRARRGEIRLGAFQFGESAMRHRDR